LQAAQLALFSIDSERVICDVACEQFFYGPVLESCMQYLLLYAHFILIFGNGVSSKYDHGNKFLFA
jgi:hypothetical protein